MTTATVTPTKTRPLRDWIRAAYLQWRLAHCERDIEHCQHGIAALERQEGIYRDVARARRAELRALGAL